MNKYSILFGVIAGLTFLSISFDKPKTTCLEGKIVDQEFHENVFRSRDLYKAEVKVGKDKFIYMNLYDKRAMESGKRNEIGDSVVACKDRFHGGMTFDYFKY